MAHFNKIGLLVLDQNQTKFLVCEKYPQDMTTDYIIPGGQIEDESEVDCIKREIKEELNCDVDDKLEYVGDYHGPAAGGGELYMKLYKGKLVGTPKPSDEIKSIHWIGKEDSTNLKVSLFIRTKIIPSLLEKGLLK